MLTENFTPELIDPVALIDELELIDPVAFIDELELIDPVAFMLEPIFNVLAIPTPPLHIIEPDDIDVESTVSFTNRSDV